MSEGAAGGTADETTDERFGTDFLRAFKAFMDTANQVREGGGALTGFGRRVQDHLGVDVGTLSVLSEEIAPHRLVDADIALAELGEGGELIGTSAAGNRDHEPLPALLSNEWRRFEVAAADYALAPSGPSTTRRVVSFGLRLLTFEGEPVAVLQRAANPRVGREQATLEVLATESAIAERLLAALHGLMHERSVLRGQVLSLASRGHFGEGPASMFVQREAVPEADVVLAPGVLDRIRDHVIGIGEHREELLAAGRHLKRGVLLYGPPGTGKTLTVRHLVGATGGTTVVLLTGPSIGYISEATDLARALQPSMVVLEDIDLVATERGRFGPQPLLFAVLDALDGLDGDADVTFLMTTNRVDVLERALAQRPGRVDLAVEVPRPDPDARRRLFALYARGLPLGGEALEAAADRAEGVTASFAKELMRRVVLRAAIGGTAITDADLAAVLDEMLDAGAALTRSLLGMERENGADAGDGGPGDGPIGREGDEGTVTVAIGAFSPHSGTWFQSPSTAPLFEPDE